MFTLRIRLQIDGDGNSALIASSSRLVKDAEEVAQCLKTFTEQASGTECGSS